jgi:hypothetical protein
MDHSSDIPGHHHFTYLELITVALNQIQDGKSKAGFACMSIVYKTPLSLGEASCPTFGRNCQVDQSKHLSAGVYSVAPQGKPDINFKSNQSIAHEIGHTASKRHTNKFWKTVELVYPNYKKAQQLLNDFMFEAAVQTAELIELL